MKFNFLLDPAAVLTILAIILFATGQAYITGYLDYFSIDPFSLGFSIQDKMYLGYINSFSPSLIYFLIACIYFYLIKTINNELKLGKRIQDILSSYINITRKPIKEHSPPIHNETYKTQSNNKLSILIARIFSILIIYIGSYLFLGHIETEAHKKAAKDWNDKSFTQINIKGSKANSIFYKIQCGSSDLCVISDSNENIYLEDSKNIINKINFNETKK